MQDLLKLDSKARFNIPGTSENNWVWRLEDINKLNVVKENLTLLNKSTERT